MIDQLSPMRADRPSGATHRRSPAAIACIMMLASGSALAANIDILHVFKTPSDSERITYGVVMDGAGALYGTDPGSGPAEEGAVFRLQPPGPGETKWTQSVIHNFGFKQDDGAQPRSPLSVGKDGKITGTTTQGGSTGVGTIFTLAAPAGGGKHWKEAIVHSFKISDGEAPESVPVEGPGGVSYGVTLGGGPDNLGTVYSLTGAKDDPTVTVLHTFSGGDGALTDGNLIVDKAGSLYGMNLEGGAAGFGNIFRLSPPVGGGAWQFTVLHTFSGGADGRAPENALYMDKQGVLWSTNASGGSETLGNVFSLTPPIGGGTGAWKFNTVYEFKNGADGGAPHSGLLPDGQGGFYGTAGVGGNATTCGTIYHMAPPAQGQTAWTLNPLWAFTGGTGGGFPYGELIMKDGALYGTTFGSSGADGLQCNASSVAFQLPL
jgi:hypothetical protein